MSTRILIPRGLRAAFFSTVLAWCFAASAAPVEILLPMPLAKSSASMRLADGVKTEAMAVKFNAPALHAMAIGDEALLSLPNGQQYRVRTDRISEPAEGIVSWVGTLVEHGQLNQVIATTGPGGTYATIITPSGEWAIAPGNIEGVDVLVNATREAAMIRRAPDTEQRDYRISHPSLDDVLGGAAATGAEAAVYERNRAAVMDQALRAASAANLGITKITPTPTVTVDLLVVVTQGFASAKGANLETRIQQAITATNQAYANSEVAISLRKVGPTLIRDYGDAPPGKEQALTDLTNNTGVFADVEETRASVGADLVVLLRNINDGGVAWLGQVRNIGGIGGAESWNNPGFMYGVVGVCDFAGTGCDSIFAHELGHNMGLQHDRANADNPLFPGLRSYSFGWKINVGNANRDFRTIMSYAPPNNRSLVFSNPNVFLCNPTAFSPADACGVANSEDNARVLNENRFMISAIKAATGAAIPARVVLSVSPNRYPLTATSASFKVFRLGNSSQAISVNYSSINGTAAAGVDYTAAAGTLSWAAGDTTVRTVTIPLLNSGATNDRTFSIALSNPSAGLSVVAPSQVVVTRAAAGMWPVNNAIPRGWVQTAGANASWVVTDTSAQEGSFSLRSGAIGDNQTASIQFTATMLDGNLTFYRKVSSESGYDFFRVYVDGVEVAAQTVAGEADWEFVAIPVTAGLRTIRFSYEKDSIVASGADAVWIDFVEFPTSLCLNGTPPANANCICRVF